MISEAALSGEIMRTLTEVVAIGLATETEICRRRQRHALHICCPEF